jgi:hypothetical protein
MRGSSGVSRFCFNSSKRDMAFGLIFIIASLLLVVESMGTSGGGLTADE